MKKIEELLNLDLGRKFATPKKLNRSANSIPASVIERLEGREFSAEMMEELSRDFPIFHYRTCITIHGAWPEINISSVGAYKNVHQNGNGSVEVRYSAIDRKKIDKICSAIQGTGCPFHFGENSSDRYFRFTRNIDKDNFQQVRAEMEPIAKRLADLPIYGFVNLYRAALPWGGNLLVLEMHPLAIREEHVNAVVLALSGLTQSEYDVKIAEYKVKQELEEKERLERRAEYEKKARDQKALVEARLKENEHTLAHLPVCDDIRKGILVKLTHDRVQDKLFFLYYRLDGKGSFGRYRWSRMTSETFITEGLDFKPQKEETIQEILKLTSKDFRLLQPAEQPLPVQKPVKGTDKKTNWLAPGVKIQGCQIVRYSERSVVVKGETKPVKDILASLNGSYNAHLKDEEGNKFPGWVFPLSRKSELELIIEGAV